MASAPLAQRRWRRSWVLGAAATVSVVGISIAAPTAGGALRPSVATRPSCTAVSIATLDKALDIDAAKVNSVRPARPAGTLICSYYGLSGGVKNEATIDYLPATPAQFSAIEADVAKQHRVVAHPGIDSGGYSFDVPPVVYLSVLDDETQVQLYATVTLGRLKRLARLVPQL